MLANYHTHTARCNHAFGTEREYIENAIQNGFKILGFSDHVPQPYPADYESHIRMRMEEAESYTDTLVKLRDEYKSDIQILIGYEVEYTRKFFDKMLEHIRQYPLDYIIQGQHFIPNEIDGFYAGAMTTQESSLAEYVEFTVEGMKTGKFSYLAHPDLINYVGPDEVFQKHMKEIIQTSIDLDIPLEVNMLGFMTDRNYPSDRFYSLAASMGAKFVIGCDAHNPVHVMQPNSVSGFIDFLNKNKIKPIQDNIIELKPV
ncbi:histidinol-phosphatase [Pseudobutyrivibrio sp.]|uniref:histidinol-phosphatase n=1 Tax=Pseudobutyrivibrio sp. TaxID=2014367 RepID=UPI0025F460CC|nr:histidinol-phosphatase [Pseudobutyrivibrio sp.]